MDIHKPKPFHGWREFLKEFGIIVLGVLTALGLEQAVEAVHTHGEVSEAREALRGEIGSDISRLAFQIAEDKCLMTQVDAYAAWAEGGPKPPELRFFSPVLKVSSWDTVKVGAVPHMPLKERLALANFYDFAANEVSVNEHQRDAHLVLMSLSDRRTLDAADAIKALDAVALERRLAHIRTANAAGLIRLAVALGVHEPKMDPGLKRNLDWVCSRGGADPFDA
jgi:hypothetical protein